MEADEAQADWSCNIQSTKPSGNGYFRSAPHHVTPVVVVSVVSVLCQSLTVTCKFDIRHYIIGGHKAGVL